MRVQRLPEPEHRLQHVVREQLLVAVAHVEDRWSTAEQQAASHRGDWRGPIDVRKRHVGGEIDEATQVRSIEIQPGKAGGRFGVWRQRAPRRDQPDAPLTVERRDANVGA